MDTSADFTRLLDKYLTQTISAEEQALFFTLVRERKNMPELQTAVAEALNTSAFDVAEDAGLREELFRRILKERADMQTTKRIALLHRWRWAAAAVFILAVGTTTAIVVSSNQQAAKSGSTVAQPAASDIFPGTNKAVLTIDNKKIDLSPGKTGITVGENIAYTDGERLAEVGTTMLLATPNGGQYQLVLPDGTRAWLNAASSIRFPSVFPDGKRQIKIVGEVYLEVAKDKARPFFVDVDGKSILEVLGTSFNVNSYADDANIRTTLVEGSVKVSNILNGGRSVTLRPGEQALQTAEATPHQQLIIQSADIEQTLAWKNGLFNFNGVTVPEVMKQLARWYDIDVRYEGAVPTDVFRGKLYRNVKLSFVLEMLRDMGIKYKIDGKTLIIL